MRIVPALVISRIAPLVSFVLAGFNGRAWTPLQIGGVVLAVVSFALVLVARAQLGKSFSVRPEARELVTHGLYARIRHPMYVFLDLMLLGLILVLGWYWLLAALAALAVGQALQSRREAKVLQEKFGPAYAAYRKQTWF